MQQTIEEEAAGQLRTIRALMERATVYRALSAPAAAIAGLLCVGLCGWLGSREGAARPDPVWFIGIWVVLFAVASLVNFRLLHRSAVERGEPFVSAGMKHALQAIMPPLGAGFVLSVAVALGAAPGQGAYYTEIVSCWVLFYGLALLATGSFAPRSMYFLGLGFFFAGLAICLLAGRASAGDDYAVALGCMALTFGLLHVVYAAAVFFPGRRSRRTVTA